MPIKVGDKVNVMREVWDGIAWTDEPSDQQARIMSIAEGYAMLRFKGCMPFFVTVKDLERWNTPTIPLSQLATMMGMGDPKESEA